MTVARPAPNWVHGEVVQGEARCSRAGGVGCRHRRARRRAACKMWGHGGCIEVHAPACSLSICSNASSACAHFIAANRMHMSGQPCAGAPQRCKPQKEGLHDAALPYSAGKPPAHGMDSHVLYALLVLMAIRSQTSRVLQVVTSCPGGSPAALVKRMRADQLTIWAC